MTAFPNGPALETSVFLEDVLEGVSAPARWLPSKYFYDRAGSVLFDQICELEEYYPTRVETDGPAKRLRRDVLGSIGKAHGRTLNLNGRLHGKSNLERTSHRRK